VAERWRVDFLRKFARGKQDFPPIRVSALDRLTYAFPDCFSPQRRREGFAQAIHEQRNRKGSSYMALYEHTFMARQDISAQQAEALAEQFKGVLEENGGSVSKVENWGLKTAAYRIQKNRKVHYIHMNVDAPAAALAEMERQMRINEDILRYMTIRVEEHEEGPSAMMKKNDRDDRPRRGGDRDDRGPRPDRSAPREDKPSEG